MNNISKIENDEQTYEYFNQPIDNNVNVQQPQKKTRNRQALSCTECKRRKIKCDRDQPCGACVKRGAADQCRWEEKKVIKSNKPLYASFDEVAQLRHSLSDTRNLLKDLISHLRYNGISLPNDVFSNQLDMPLIRPSTSTDSGMVFGNDIENEETAAAFTLEGIAMGRKPVAFGSAMNDEATMLRRKRTDSTSSKRQPENVIPETPRSQSLQLPLTGPVPVYCDPPLVTTSFDSQPIGYSSFPFTPKLPSSVLPDKMTKSIIQYLPNRAKSDTLVKFYIDHLEWLHKPLHTPSFLLNYEQYWNEMSVGYSTDLIDTRWLALYASVLCVSTHFGGDYYFSDTFGNSHLEGRNENEAEIYYQISRSALSQSDFLINHSLEAIQTIIILGLFLHNKNQTETHLVLMSTAIKMAQLMGLSRIPDEFENSEKQGNIVERELGRRLWHSLVFQDSFNASASSYSYAIHTDQMTTSVPMNVDDDKIKLNEPIPSETDDVWTDMSYFRSKLQFANITRKIVDTLNRDSSGTYPFVLQMDSEYREALDQIPSFLRLDMSEINPTILNYKPCRAWERLMMSFTIHNRLMRLHRGYMTEGYSNPQYSYSTTACVASAKTLLALMKEGKKFNWPASRWWVVLIQCWTASIVILIDLFYTVEEEEAELKSNEVLEALIIFRDIQHVSTVAKKAVLTLERLIDEDKSRRNSKIEEVSNKRRKISIDGFTPIGLAPNVPGLHNNNNNNNNNNNQNNNHNITVDQFSRRESTQPLLDSVLPMPSFGSQQYAYAGPTDVWESMFRQEMDILNDITWQVDEYDRI